MQGRDLRLRNAFEKTWILIKQLDYVLEINIA